MDLSVSSKIAYFEANEFGRILLGNQYFCQMFGFKEREIRFHYLSDFYRYSKDWLTYKSHKDISNFNFIAKMKTRKGRSFKCLVTRETIEDSFGKIRFKSTIRKIHQGELKYVDAQPEGKKMSLIFLSKCENCGMQIPIFGRIHNNSLFCQRCANKLYPQLSKILEAQV